MRTFRFLAVLVLMNAQLAFAADAKAVRTVEPEQTTQSEALVFGFESDTCEESCVKKITDALEAVAGVRYVNVDAENKVVVIAFWKGKVSQRTLTSAFEKAGFPKVQLRQHYVAGEGGTPSPAVSPPAAQTPAATQQAD